MTKRWFQTGMGGAQTVRLYTHRHPKGVLAEQSVTGPHWVTWSSNCPIAVWVRSSVQWLWVGSANFIHYFDLGNPVNIQPIGRPLVLMNYQNDAEVEDRIAIIYGELHLVSFASLFLAHCFCPTPLCRSHMICTQTCIKYLINVP